MRAWRTGFRSTTRPTTGPTRTGPRFADALILRMPGGGNPFPLEPAQWEAIVSRAPVELHLVGKTVLTAAALAAAGATAIREVVRSVTHPS